MISRVTTFLRGLFQRSRMDRELDEELAFHLDMMIEENLRAGMSPSQARREAKLSFGGLQQVRESTHDERGSGWLEALVQDLRYGLRMLRRRPAFSLFAVLTLALGIGSNSAIFSVIQGVLLRPLPYPEAEELVLVWQNDRLRGTSRERVSVPDFLDYRAESESLDELAAWREDNRTLTAWSRERGERGTPERLSVARVSANYFRLLGVQPLLGRDLLLEEDGRGREHVALLGEGLWKRRFGGDPGVVGSEVTLDDESYTVVGVMPATAAWPGSPAELWIPIAFREEESYRGMHILITLGRLAEGRSLEQAQTEMSTIMARLEKEYEDDNLGRGAVVVRLEEQLVGQIETALWILQGAVLLILLTACANVANLFLSQATVRRRELALRSALGAGRGRVVRQLLTEGLLLALAGGGIGLLVAQLGVRVLVRSGPSEIPRLDEIRLDSTVLLFTLAVILLTWLLFSVLPAFKATRRDPQGSLRDGHHGSSVEGHLLRRILATGELALAVVLVIGAGLLIRSLDELRRVEPGFHPEGIVAATVSLPDSKYPFPEGWPVLEWAAFDAFSDEAEERLEALPGVRSVSSAVFTPLVGGWTTRMTVDGRPAPPPGEREEAEYRPVGVGYFQTLGIPLLMGRVFDHRDRGGAPPVAVVNQAFVRRHFPEGRPLLQSISVYGVSRQIVGVVGDVRFRGLVRETPPAMYLPFLQNPQPELTFFIAADGDPGGLIPAVREQLAAIDPDLALFGVQRLDDALIDSRARQRFTTSLLALFAAVALLLATVGVYGVVSYSVSRRTQEIGVRMALGAGRTKVLGEVLVSGMKMALLGLGAGLLGAFVLAGLLESLLFGVAARDLLTFVLVPLILAAVALLACYLPARRASRIDPLRALRYE